MSPRRLSNDDQSDNRETGGLDGPVPIVGVGDPEHESALTNLLSRATSLSAIFLRLLQIVCPCNGELIS